MCAATLNIAATGVAYDGIGFQGRTGILFLTTEKLVFREHGGCRYSRSWLWPSIKKTHVVPLAESSADDIEEVSSMIRTVKLFNCSNKAVSFQVPDDLVQELVEDLDTMMQQLRDKHGETVSRALQLALAAKAANEAAWACCEPCYDSDEERVYPEPMVMPSMKVETTKPKIKRAKSHGDAFLTTKTSKRSGKGESLTRSSSDLRGNSQRKLKTPSDRQLRGPGNSVRRNRNGTKQGKVTLLNSTMIITQDLFIRPSQQIAHDFVVRPTNNLIVKPTRRNIIDPTQEHVLRPAHEKVLKPAHNQMQQRIIKPAHNKILKPAHNKILKPAHNQMQQRIIKPAHNRILKPAHEKILKPAHNQMQQRIIKPAHNRILKPTHERILKPAARGVGLLPALSVDEATNDDGEAKKTDTEVRKSASSGFLSSVKKFPMKVNPLRRSHCDDPSASADIAMAHDGVPKVAVSATSA
ncbi:expressed unknown protein [Seminavis robusta]|uniref:Uncharacterized protein n=1 Tax=Seminavis robusta TaxID=568900 RepID=A0A9N8E2B9_9STRA|nr:expressed unknown protein [Seminavis robusta]|eukprot:Sro474_g150220.1 n/a (467) ;mRNA; f:24049-25449